MTHSDTEKKKEEQEKRKSLREPFGGTCGRHCTGRRGGRAMEEAGDVTLGCAANSAATFHLHTRVNAQPALCALSFSRTLQKPAASLGVKWLLP